MIIPGLEPWAQQALGAGAGLAIGMLVGLERGYKLRSAREGTRVAGIRTFSLVGLGSGVAGIVAGSQPLAAAVILAAIAAPLIIAYAPRLARRGDSTSPVAAAATIAAAFVAGLGSVGLALAAAAVIVLLLASKDRLHHLVERMDREDVQALARYAVIALAVLPFLPNRAMGPLGAWNPSKLWLVVVIVTGFSFLGYVANRLFGERHGTIATALIGGAYSSTAVTQSLSQRLGQSKQAGAESAGIALATAVMYLRVLLLVGILASRVLIPFALVLAPALATAWVAGFWLYRRAPSGDKALPPGNPIALLPALGFVLFVALAAVAVAWARGRFGESGTAVLLLITGTMDVDVAIITLGGLPPEAISAGLAAIAIAGTIIANMAVKIGVTLVYARRNGLAAAAALGASALVLALSIFLAWTVLYR